MHIHTQKHRGADSQRPTFSLTLITLTILLVGTLITSPGIAAPSAQQDTPTPKWPTPTPVPPTDTPTPVPPTNTPTPTAIPPTSAPKPKSTPRPAPTPVPVLLPETGGTPMGVAVPSLLLITIGLISYTVYLSINYLPF
jgi:hypothetical protein